MSNSGRFSEKYTAILEIARLAPSVHNTQPWVVEENSTGLIVSIDPSHRLAAGDPTGRQTIISLGIFIEAIGIGCGVHGMELLSVRFADSQAHLEIKNTTNPSRNFDELVIALKHRCSDRSIYQSVTVEDDVIALLESSVSSPNVQVRVTTDRSSIEKIAQLTSQGIRMALSNPSFRNELSHYLLPPWSTKRRGISVKSLYLPYLVGLLQPIFIRLGKGLNAESRLEKKRWESASAVIAITSVGDMPDYWLEAGRTYLRVSLALEQAGFSQATSAALVEASNFHEDVEKMFDTTQRLVCMLRIGKGSYRRHYSPRVSVQELTT